MGQGNYGGQVDTALQQANLPKSTLSQQMSNTFSGGDGGPLSYNNVLNQLGQIGNFNAFPGYQSGASTPGAMTGQQPNPNQFPPINYPPTQNQFPPVQQPGAGGPSNTGGAGSITNPQNTTPNDTGTPSQGLGGGLGFRLSANQLGLPNFNVSPSQTPQVQNPASQSQAGPMSGITSPNQSQPSQFLGDASLNVNPQGGQRPSAQPGTTPQLSNIPVMQNGIAPIQQANPTLAGMNTQQMNNQAYNTLLQQLQSPQVSGFNPSNALLNNPALNQQFSGLQGLGISGLSNALGNQINGASQGYNPQQVSLQSLGNGQVQNLPQAQQQFNPASDPYYQAVQQSLQNQQTLDQKNLQAQFGASGGAGRGTPAAFAQAQLMAQQSPQMAAALGQVAQQEQQNQLQATGLNQNALLSNQQLGNQFGIQQQGNQLSAQQANQQAGLQAAGLGNQNLSVLGSLLNNNQGQQLQNYLGTIGANQQQQGLLAQLANQAGNQNLQQNQLGSQNIFNAAQINSQNANNALQNQLGFQTNQNQAMLGQNNLLSQLSQFNAGQGNQLNQQYSQQAQTANQNQINNQMASLQNLAQIMSQFGLSGIPGGSANVNLGAQSQNTLQSLAGIL